MRAHAHRLGRIGMVAGGALATATICAGSVALAIVAFPLADYQPPAEAPLRDEPVGVVSRTTRRTTTATVELEWSRSRTVKVGDAAGKVTAVFVAAGTPVACGAPVAAVDGAVVWALCGDTPLWRDVAATTKGRDADAVADLLIGRGLLAEADRTNGRRRADAIKTVQRFLGQPATGVFGPSDVVFIGDQVTPTRVLVAVGDRVSGDTDLLAIDAGLRSATLAAAPTTPGWVFAVEGSPKEFPVGADGGLDVAAIEPAVTATMEGPDATLPLRVQGQLRLAVPISFVGVPPSALVTAPDGSTCVVLASGGSIRVEVVDSVTGMVTVDADLDEGTLIRNLPGAGTTC